MRLRTIRLLSLLPLWLCVLQHTPLRGQDATPSPASPAPIPAVDAPLQTQAQQPVHAHPGPTISSSVSSNKQFVVHGGDLSVRSTFCLMSEEAAGTLGRLLKDDGRYAIPVVVEIKTPPNVNPAEPTVKTKISLMDFGGFHLQLSVQLRNDFRTEDYYRELVRILLAERILRNHKDINTQREKPILPEWLLTGVMQAMEFRSRSRPSVLFAAVFKSGQVYSIDRILAADPKNLDALSRGVYEVSSCALLLTLLDQPDGPLRVAKFLDALATDDRADRELLQQHFPTLGASKNSLEKWWTLQMASLSTPSAFETMTIKETEEMLDKALTLHFTSRIGEEPADIKAGREGKGILGWLKRDEKTKSGEKEKEASKPGEVAATVSNAPQMPISSSPSSALPVEGASSAELPEPLGKPAPDLNLLPSSLPPPSSRDSANTNITGAASPAPQDAPPPMPEASAPAPAAEAPPASPDAAPAAPVTAPKEKETDTPAAASEEQPKQKPAPEKPKPRSPAPKPAAKPAAAGKDNAKPAAPTPQAKGKTTEKPAEPAKAEETPPEEPKERKRFRFPNIFGGKDVTYTLMLLAMAAVAENAADASAKGKESQKAGTKEEQKAGQEEAVPALPSNNRRVGARPAGVPENQTPAKPATTPAPSPKPSEATPDAAEEGKAEEKKPNRFNPFGWLKRGDKEKKEDATSPPDTTSAAEAGKPAAMPPPTNPARAATDLPEKAIAPPSQPSRTASRASSSNSGASSSSKAKPGLAALEDYRRIWKRSDREDILSRNLAMLNALKVRAHPLYKPLVEDYATVVQQLVNGKERGVDEKLETLRQRRMQIQGKAKSVESFLDWYEASETQNYSNLFDDYLKLRDRLEREKAQRADELSRYLDALEKEYE